VDAVFFESGEEMEAWLDENHADEPELWLGLYKKGSGKSGITLAEAQDVALRFGWVDSLAGRIDDDAWKLRFTPRRPNSNWTEQNVTRAEELSAQGLMHEAGTRAFEGRKR
jgi:uncharacterized protein YdeI (YjbR/CyaY-like superfamily)